MMKTALVIFLLTIALVFGQAPKDAKDSKDAKAPAHGFPHTKSEDVLVKLQGENKDLWIVSFYQPGDNKEEVYNQIKEQLGDDFKEDHYAEVSLSAGFTYQKLYETLDLMGEPRRGHTTPQVLVMRDGEGYVVHGPMIADGISKRIRKVKEKTVFGPNSKK